MEIRIDGWRKGIRFSSAHLTADLGKCERLHGHTYAIHAIVEGTQAQKRIVLDFVDITHALKAVADELDHYILIPADGGRYSVKTEGEDLVMSFDSKAYRFPKGDCYQLPTPSATAEDLVTHIMEEFKKRVEIPSNVTRVRVGVDEGFGQGAWTEWRRGE